MATLELNVFGFPEVRIQDRAVVFKTRKTLALLVYLALEPGWHSRDKLAGLLWPEVGQDQGRGSLRKSLTLMRQALGDAFPLVVERERVALESGRVQTDLALLEPDSTDLPSNWEEGVLRDFSLPDTPPFDEWLNSQREAIQKQLDATMRTRFLEFKAVGQTELALALVKRRIALDPLNEEAHLEAMRLLWKEGQSAQALEVFRGFRKRLHGELGLNPSVEMIRLVQSIQGHAASLLRPTLKSERVVNQVPLVGREGEWKQMEEAWEKGQLILIGGTAGVGKSRLALEFCASKGATLRVWGRQGDEGIPYATHARNFAHAFFDQPEVTDRLPDWVRAEIARIIPWMGRPPPHPIRNEAEKLRFLEAKVEINKLMADGQGWDMFFFDDLQFTDSATAEVGLGVQRRLLPYPPGFFRSVFAFRSLELPEVFADGFRRWVDEGLAIWIELQALPPEAVEQWLRHRNAGDLTPSIMGLTGGNPLFIHETLQALEDHPQGTALPRSQRAKQVLWERLERLSPPAKAMAQIAALSTSDFSLNLGEWVLGLEPETAEQVAQELQQGGIFKGQGFSHDLLYETTLENISPERKVEFSARIAEYLELHQPYIAPARLARHYLNSNQPRQAAGYLLEAGRQAVDTFVLDQAANWFELAAQALQGSGRTGEALEVLYQVATLRANAKARPG